MHFRVKTLGIFGLLSKEFVPHCAGCFFVIRLFVC